jgi:beta-lactamase superfamily II metal-dependent hydrolase
MPFWIHIFDVEHGACAMLLPPEGDRMAMVDCGHNSTSGWRPSTYLKDEMGRSRIDYLFLTNADQDHISDLDRIWEDGIAVGTLTRNRSIENSYLRELKKQSGKLSRDMERYLAIDLDYSLPVTEPFDEFMGGVKVATYYNTYPEFKDTNDLSVAAFFSYAGFKILFPGDLEKRSWRKLLERDAFKQELKETTIVVASHHGRENGFCPEIFEFCKPRAVVISDKPIEHETQQMVPDYRAVVHDGVQFSGGDGKTRHVLTTRRDGNILFKVYADGSFDLYPSSG